MDSNAQKLRRKLRILFKKFLSSFLVSNFRGYQLTPDCVYIRAYTTNEKKVRIFFKKSFPARVFEKETFVDGLGLFLYFIFHHLTPHLEILLPLFFQAFKEGAAASTTTAAAAPPPEKKGGPPKKTDDRQTEAI